MPKRRQPQTPYDTVFDFIFGSYKPKKDKRKPPPPIGVLPPLDTAGDILAQVAMSPMMFPTNQFMRDLDREIDGMLQFKTEPVKGAEIKVGPSSLGKLLSDPRKFVNKAFEDYEAGKKMGKWGAVTRGMDSAVAGIMAKHAGFDAATAFAIAGGLGGAGISSPSITNLSQASVYRAQHNAASNLAKAGAIKFSGNGIGSGDLEKIISDSSKAASTPGQASFRDKDLRKQKVVDELVARGVSAADAKKYANEVWGDDNPLDPHKGGDLGIWFHGGDRDIDKTGTIAAKEGHFNNEEQIRRKSAEASRLIVREKIDELKRNGAPPRDIAKMEQLDQWLTKYLDSTGVRSNFFGIGRSIGSAMHYRYWLQEDILSGKAVSAILWGDSRTLKKVLTIEGLYDKPWAPAGRLVDIVDTWHPVNIAKGLTWNGTHWEKMANWAKGRGNTRLEGVLRGVGGFTPLQMWNKGKSQISGALGIGKRVNKVKDKVKEKIAGFAARALGIAKADLIGLPVKEILKQLLTKVITKLITKIFTQVVANALLPGVGILVGIVVDFAIGLVMKLAKPLVELTVLLVFGAIAIILMLCGTGASNLDRLHRQLNNPITTTEAADVDPADWATDSTAPAGMNAACLISGAISCAQGPCGSFSHNHGRRPVDLSWSGMGANPEIYAPANGKITYARTSTSCTDGTNLGGIIEFQDNTGYRWRIVHVRPLLRSGATVTAGQAIAEVQFSPEVESGDCWTGPHAHVEVQNASGQYVDAEEFLNSTGCTFTCPGSCT